MEKIDFICFQHKTSKKHNKAPRKNFKLKFEFSDYRFERVNGIIGSMKSNVLYCQMLI